MVYILLGDGFEEAEALVAADVLRRGNVEVSLTGVGGMTVRGAHGIAVAADTAAENVSLRPGDTVLLPGGMGGVDSLEHSAAAMALAREAAGGHKMYLAAICAAPTLLARAGLIGKGSHAVCYPGMEGELISAGVTPHMDEAAVVDGALVTGRGPGAAFDFALTLLNVLKGPEAAEAVRAGLHYKD